MKALACNIRLKETTALYGGKNKQIARINDLFWHVLKTSDEKELIETCIEYFNTFNKGHCLKKEFEKRLQDLVHELKKSSD